MRKALAEGLFVALHMGKAIPIAAQDAFIIVETGCRPTLSELDAMPKKLVDSILLYGAVKNTIEQGGTMKL